MKTLYSKSEVHMNVTLGVWIQICKRNQTCSLCRCQGSFEFDRGQRNPFKVVSSKIESSINFFTFYVYPFISGKMSIVVCGGQM